MIADSNNQKQIVSNCFLFDDQKNSETWKVVAGPFKFATKSRTQDIWVEKNIMATLTHMDPWKTCTTRE
jgi:hypothetical protein